MLERVFLPSQLMLLAESGGDFMISETTTSSLTTGVRENVQKQTNKQNKRTKKTPALARNFSMISGILENNPTQCWNSLCRLHANCFFCCSLLKDPRELVCPFLGALTLCQCLTNSLGSPLLSLEVGALVLPILQSTIWGHDAGSLVFRSHY